MCVSGGVLTNKSLYLQLTTAVVTKINYSLKIVPFVVMGI